MGEIKYCLNQLCKVLCEIDMFRSLIMISKDCHGEPNYVIVENKYLFDKPSKINILIEKIEERYKRRKEELDKKEMDLEKREKELEKKTGTKEFGF